MRVLGAVALLLLSGCASLADDVDALAPLESKMGFTAIYEGGECKMTVQLQDAERIFAADSRLVPAMKMTTTFNRATACLGILNTTVWLDGDGREIRALEHLGPVPENHVGRNVGDPLALVFFHAHGSLAPWGFFWPEGPARITYYHQEVPVDIVTERGMSSIRGVPDDPVRDSRWLMPGFSARILNGVPQEMVIPPHERDMDSEPLALNLVSIEANDRLGELSPYEPTTHEARPLGKAIPGGDVEVMDTGMTTGEMAAFAAQEDEEFARLWASGCLSVAASVGSSAGSLPTVLDRPTLDFERVRIEFVATDGTSSRAMEVTWSASSGLAATVVVPDGASATPGDISAIVDCTAIATTDTTTAHMLDELWHMPFDELGLPCSPYVFTRDTGQGPWIWAHIFFNGRTDSGTWWSRNMFTDAPDAIGYFGQAGMSLTDGEWSFFTVSLDDLERLDNNDGGFRELDPRHADYATQCRSVDDEAAIPPESVPISSATAHGVH